MTKAHIIDTHVGARLRKARNLQKLTLQDVAALAGIAYQQVQKYESGTNRLSASRMYIPARILGVEVSYFFDGLPGPGTTAPDGSPRRLTLPQIEAELALVQGALNSSPATE